MVVVYKPDQMKRPDQSETAAEFFKRRSAGARAEDLHAILALVPDCEPIDEDRVPSDR
jgi:hypothetical protein